jgi:putative DNA methylase
MIPKECKRLAEVDFPIAVVSKHSAREKSIRYGHPSTLHLWWARRPLAACRAMLLGLLLPDPCDSHCPKEFKARAAKALLEAPGWDNERMKRQVKSDEGLRKALLAFIGDVANWDVANNPRWIGAARQLVQAAHPDEPPLVVDPFAGGGSIPLEALRLGCEAFASDLNPVACLILKVMLEDIPRHGQELTEELRRVGKEIKEKAERELAEFYPKDSDGATPIAYLWARTVKCESPNCGAEIPLLRSFWLCRKTSRKRALQYKVVRPKNGPPHAEFEVFDPKSERDVRPGTVTRGNATCLCCNMVLRVERVRAQMAEQRGGADPVFDEKGNRIGGARMLAVVKHNSGVQGRDYRLATGRDYQAVSKAQKRLKVIVDEWVRGGKKGLCPIPDEQIPLTEIRRISVPLYGCTSWGNLFTSRQSMALSVLSGLARSQSTSSVDLTPAMNRLLALSVSKQAERLSSLVSWITQTGAPRGSFARQALGFVWDYCELVPAVEGEEYLQLIDAMRLVVDRLCIIKNKGQIQQQDACESVLPEKSVPVWFTDPPYYDSVPYAHLSDFFYVWLRRAANPDGSLPLASQLTPKDKECVVDRPHRLSKSKKNNEYFEHTMARAMAAGRALLSDQGLGSVVFAHKTTEGWESLIGGMLAGGLTVTASWPIQTERGGRLNAQEQAALATSIHLICRPRSEDAPVGDWGEVLRELPKRVGDWMERLQGEGIRGADLVFACIGPALEIFSQYRKVETADGREVKLAEYLVKVWEVVGRTALEQILGTAEAKARNGVAGALEEDARLTALFLWTLQSTNGQNRVDGEAEEDTDDETDEEEDEEESASKKKAKGFSLVFDVVRRFAQPLGIELPKWEGRVIETKKGVVRLMAVSERARQLFGEDDADTVADWIVQDPKKNIQQVLFPELQEERAPFIRSHKKGRMVGDLSAEAAAQAGVTTLDRVHAAMLLQAGGQANALRQLIKAEMERGPDFLRLANALSALYPKESEEKRLLDAMLMAIPR